MYLDLKLNSERTICHAQLVSASRQNQWYIRLIGFAGANEILNQVQCDTNMPFQ
jgi:hypothetical protein